MKIVRSTFLSLGSNIGNRLANLQEAVFQISDKIGQVLAVSSVFRSASWGYQGNEYYNICLEVSTSLNPEILLEKILAIEQTLGRTRNQEPAYADRLIDIDILLLMPRLFFTIISRSRIRKC